MEKRCKYIDGYFSLHLTCHKINKSRGVAFDADCLTAPFRILKIITDDIKMDSGKMKYEVSVSTVEILWLYLASKNCT